MADERCPGEVTLKEYDPCPKCGSTLRAKPGLFYWRGRSFSGLFCQACNSCWDNPADSMLAHVAAQAKATTDSGCTGGSPEEK